MKKTTLKHSNNLNKRLAQYGALSLAIAGIAEANGQISYTDVDPDFVGTLQSSFDVDFNNDALVDGTILQTNFAYGSSFIELIRAEAPVGNGIVANMVGAYTYGINVPYGSAIGPGAAVFSFGDMCQASGYTNSGFCSTTEDSYVGIAFEFSGNTHYGWVRLEAGSTSENFTVLDFAFETSPDTAINAGHTLGITEFNRSESVRIAYIDGVVTISNINENTQYRIISIDGKQVASGNTNLETHTIQVDNLNSGIYIVEVTNSKSNAIQHKKIVIH